MKKISSIGLCLLFFLAWTVFLFSLPARAFAEENSPPEILGEEHTSELGLSEEYIGYYGIDSASDRLWFMDAASLEGGIRALLLSDIIINEKPT